jgi:hypothetical protein
MTPEQQAAIDRHNKKQGLKSSNMNTAQEEAVRRFVAKNPDFKNSVLNPDRGPLPTMGETILTGAMRGLKDLGQGAKQKYLNIFGEEGEGEAYTEQVNEEQKQELQEITGGGRLDPGLYETMRFGGTAAPFMLNPTGAIVRALGGGSRALMGSGAVEGGLAGALMYDTENDPANSALYGGLGVAGGLAAPYVAGKVARGAVAAGQGLRNVGRTIKGTVQSRNTEQIVEKLYKSGIDVKKMSDEMRQMFIEDAKKNLRSSGQLMPDQLKRSVNIQDVSGVAPTKAQATRDPNQWTQEQNLQRIESNVLDDPLQEGLTQRYTQQASGAEKTLMDFTKELSPKIPETNFRVSDKIAKFIREDDEQARRVVGDLYKQFRNSDLDFNLQGQRVAQAAGEVQEEFITKGAVGDALNELKAYGFLGGEKTKVFNVREAEKLSKRINNLRSATGREPSDVALGQLKKAIDESIFDLPEEQLAAAPKLREARAAARKRFQEIESSKGVIKSLKDEDPNLLFERFVENGSPYELQQLKTYLLSKKGGKEVFDQARAKAYQNIIGKATQQGEKAISPAALRRELTKLGQDRAEMLFSPEELTKLDSYNRAVQDMFNPPPFERTNYSNTAAGLSGILNMMDKAGMVPGANMVTEPIRQGLQRRQFSSALKDALQGDVARPAGEFAKDMAKRKAAQTSNLVRALSQPAGAIGAINMARE